MSEGRAAMLTKPRASLSASLRETSQKEFDKKKHAQPPSALLRGSRSVPASPLKGSALESSHVLSHSLVSLPTLTQKKPSTFADTVAFYHRETDPYTRLSGLVENVNSSGLFADRTAPMKPLAMCVRCGQHASMCMSCCEEECEKTVTFYRKTHAAGAAALFTKAFVEAGNTKVIKFIVFRLLKNSFLGRKREQLKKRSVVEKLFGTNLVYLPFTAWRRFTKENIVKRKDKTVHKLTERSKILEDSIEAMTAAARAQERQMAMVLQENAALQEQLAAKSERVEQLEERLRREQARVLGLSALTVPIEAYSSAVNSLLRQKLVETNHYLHMAATTSVGYDYSHIFAQSVLQDIGRLAHEARAVSTPGGRATRVGGLTGTGSKATAAMQQILLDWANDMSRSADELIEPLTGKMLSHFLPPHSPADALPELRSGKLLARVVCAVVMDRMALRKALLQQRGGSGGGGGGGGAEMLTRSWVEPALALEDLQEIKAHEGHAMDLTALVLRLAAVSLDLPPFKAMDVFAGKAAVIQAVLVALMNASVPTVDKRAKDAVERCISTYYGISEEVGELRAQQAAAHKLLDISKFFNADALDADALVNPDHHLDADTGHASPDGSDGAVLDAHSDGAGWAEAMEPHRQRRRGEAAMGGEVDTDAVDPDAATAPPPDASASPPAASDETGGSVPPEALVLRRAHMHMSPDEYGELCAVLDEFLVNREYLAAIEQSKRVVSISEKLSELQAIVFDRRDLHEKGVAMTSELRQFVMHSFIGAGVS